MTARPLELRSEDDFRQLAEPHRRELKGYCYRMVGSVHDAEDLVQETFARAWTRRDSFEGRASLRTWLYKIATNACLDALERRAPRQLPVEVGAPAAANRPPDPPTEPARWLTPAPDGLFAELAEGPEARYSVRESVALAFLAALQHLPPKQRGVLILRDVVGWQASEVAELLELTVAAVNSAHQRARATLEARRAELAEGAVTPADDPTRALLERYIRAWEDASMEALVSLLREDATLSMPPMPGWYRGRDDIRDFLLAGPMAGDAAGRFRALPTSANGEAAVAFYQREESGALYKPLGIQVLELDGTRIKALTFFMDAALFPCFGLPGTLAGN